VSNAGAAAAAVARPGGSGLAPGAIVDGRYRVIRFLNQGGNGVVHEVEHLRTGRRLAMKSLVDDASAARLEQEARATALMKNAHVVKITDMGPAPGTRNIAPYLVMELLEGQSLRDLLDEAGQLPLELTVNIALQVCECLAEAHGRTVIHRDLKPDNLFLMKSAWPGQYDVVVLDFGVMKIAGEGPIPKGSLTRTGSTVGTPYYMSLEQLRNSSAVDARADIYSLGVVLYECLAGRKPFVADTIGDLVYALCSGPPTPLARLRPDLPPDVCDAVMRALKMNRDERQPSMAELGAALLPHGHPAFGLWLRAGEGTPPMSLTPMASLREAAPRGVVPTPASPMAAVVPIARPAAVTVATPAPMSPGAPMSGPATSGPVTPASPLATMTAVAMVPSAPSAPAAKASPTPPKGEGTVVTAAPEPRPAEEPEDAADAADALPTGPIMMRSRDNRETPTEMYQAPAFGGDRDTPTRALPAPSLPDLEAAARAAQAPGPPERANTFRMEAPRFGAGTERMLGPDARVAQGVGQEAPSGAGAPDTLHSGLRFDAPQEAPRFEMPKDAPRFDAAIEPRKTGTHAAVAPPGDKPAWQQSLDKALATVGGFVEGLVRKVRAQPPPIQYAVLATVILAALLIVVLFIVLLAR
jgi:serine/threonine-protein kinase